VSEDESPAEQDIPNQRFIDAEITQGVGQQASSSGFLTAVLRKYSHPEGRTVSQTLTF
jgi:hypothetical protein